MPTTTSPATRRELTQPRGDNAASAAIGAAGSRRPTAKGEKVLDRWVQRALERPRPVRDEGLVPRFLVETATAGDANALAALLHFRRCVTPPESLPPRSARRTAKRATSQIAST